MVLYCWGLLIISQSAKSLKSNTGVFVESAFDMQCHFIKNTLLHTAFSAHLPGGNSTVITSLYRRNLQRKKIFKENKTKHDYGIAQAYSCQFNDSCTCVLVVCSDR